MTKNTDQVKKHDYILTVGRRKTAIARVRLYAKGDGAITINGKPAQEYFQGVANKTLYQLPLQLTETHATTMVTVKVAGGGPASQLGAVVHGIARALEKLDREKYRPILKKHGLLTRDPRTRQRRMVGMGGKSRRKKQSPKR